LYFVKLLYNEIMKTFYLVLTEPVNHPFFVFCFIVLIISTGFALPAAYKHRTWKSFFLGILFFFLGILLPLFVFVLSGALIPEGKDECGSGWLSCFHAGKIALIPLVLWACASFYVIQILKPVNKYPPWVVLGIFMGSIISCICSFYGGLFNGSRFGSQFLIVPFYVAIWYSVLFFRAKDNAQIGFRFYLFTLLGSIPFWVMSIILSRKKYLSLPEHAPECFIVTAANNGHTSIVGPFMEINRRGVNRKANRQLLTFWKFENIWQHRSPRSHRIFRCIYNRLGPVIAKRVTTPFAADVVYLLIKPFEFLAATVVNWYKA
jgi:uncharacterized protein DUF6688